MKQKDWLMVLLVLAVGYIAYTGGIFGGGGLGSSTGAPVVVAENKASLLASCYDLESGLENGKVGVSTLEVIKNGGAIYSAADGDGSYSLDTNQGLQAGDSIIVRCMNNTDDGYYEARSEAKVLVAGANSIAVPMKKVGDLSLSFTSASVTIGANDYKSVEYDLATDTIREYYYKPIIALKDLNATDQVFASGEITDVVFSGGQKVACDTDASITGYSFCGQLDKEWVSSADIVDDAKLWFQSASSNPAGYITVTIWDGVPFGTYSGAASINRANAYDSDQAGTGTITVA